MIELNLPPDVEEAYLAAATAKGIAVDALVTEVLITQSLCEALSTGDATDASGLVEEDGLTVYKTGRPLPLDYFEGAIRRSRRE